MSTKEKKKIKQPFAKKIAEAIVPYTFWKVDDTAYTNQPALIEKLARANETLKKVGMPKSFTR
ncbi:hypothetical protein [Capnocytophaga sp. oral taxon 878]|uniref:hypothetical protein n=1 Tax=Capnocytophaga sp. oral taxon 878 TaxID=1316596 RepID=UPI000D02E1FA|nr:hypothetical protein [Capnocytophaga sp. oral taxon 878]AVM51008.1 hypothetical protein C4H12_11335 [Capnocytophaga sp. oral taxon 878]